MTGTARRDRRHAGLGPGRRLLPGLPGPVRRQRAGPQARTARAVGRAADDARVQGRRPARHRRAPAVPRGPRGHRALPEPGLPVGLEPSLPHVRLLHGRPAARRQRRAARAARRGPRAAGCGSSSTASSTTPGAASGRSTTSSRTGAARRTGAGSTSTRAPSTPAGRCWRTRPRARRRARSGTRPGGGSRRCPSWTPRTRTVREYLMTVAEHWLRFGIDGWRLDVPEEINDEAFWQEFRRRCRAVRPDAYLVGEIWRVAPEWLRGDRFDALMDYPLAEAILGFAGGSRLDMGVVRSHDEYAREHRAARRARRSPARLDGPARRRTTPEVVAAQLQPARLARHAADADRPRRRRHGRPPRDAAPGDPARRPVHLLRRRDRAGRRQRPGLPARVPVGRVALGRRAARLRARPGPGPAPAEPALRPDAVVDGRRGRRRGRLRAAARRTRDRRRRQRRRRPGAPRAPPRASRTARALEPSTCLVGRCGRRRMRWSSGGVAAVDLGPRSGSILRVG